MCHAFLDAQLGDAILPDIQAQGERYHAEVCQLRNLPQVEGACRKTTFVDGELWIIKSANQPKPEVARYTPHGHP